MVVKQTKMDEIEAYGGRGIGYFDDIEAQLKDLIDGTVEVIYNGLRARDFKSTCVQNAIDFNTTASTNMQQMATVVKSASEFIATNLGGRTLDLEPPEIKTLDMPDLNVDDTIETADDTVLKDLQLRCNTVYDAVATLFDTHMRDFDDLGASEAWMGPEYDNAQADLHDLTAKMHTGIEESRGIMEQAITTQLADLNM